MSFHAATRTSPLPSGEQLMIRAAQAGDEAACCSLVHLHEDPVRASIARFALLRGVVDDVAQECFLAAFRDLQLYDGRVPFRHWLLGIARHRALQWLESEGRRRAREVPNAAEILLTIPAPNGDHRDDPRDDESYLQAMRCCLGELPAASARLVHAHYHEGRAAGELAAGSGRSESAVRVALMRLRRSLRACVERRLLPIRE